MPFEIENSGLDSCASKPEDSTVAFRTRTVFIPRQSDVEKKPTRSCGRDAVINKPYQPLGSMQSVLNLTIKKKAISTREDEEESDLFMVDKRRGADSTNPKKSEHTTPTQLIAGNESRNHVNESNNQPPHSSTEQNQDASSLAKDIWKIRHKMLSAQRGGAASSGFKDILTSIKSGNERVKAVRAGTSFYHMFQKNDPVESAKWASEIALRKAIREGECQIDGAGEREEERGERDGEEGIVANDGSQKSDTRDNNDKTSAIRSGTITRTPRRPVGVGSALNRRPSLRENKVPTKLSTVERLRGEFDQILAKGKAEHPQQRPPSQQQQSRPKRRLGEQPRRGNRRASGHVLTKQNSSNSSSGLFTPEEPGELDFSALMQRGSKLAREGTFRKSIQSSLLQDAQRRRSRQKGGGHKTQDQNQSHADAREISEREKRHLPSYILHFSKRVNQGMSKEAQEVKSKLQYLRGSAEQELKDKAHNKAEASDEKEEQRKEQQEVLERIQRATFATKSMERNLLLRAEEFVRIKKRLEEQLGDKIETIEYDRGSEYRRKFVALDIVLNKHLYHTHILHSESGQDVDGFDTRKQLKIMRATSRELGIVQRQYNLANSVWFQTLVSKVREMKQTLTPVEQKFLAALRQLIIEGWMLTPELFKQVILQVLSADDHRSPPVQRLIGLIRDNVLKMDLEEYLDFLRENKLHVPKSLLDKISHQNERKQAGALSAGMRAAAIAMKWKRKTIFALTEKPTDEEN